MLRWLSHSEWAVAKCWKSKIKRNWKRSQPLPQNKWLWVPVAKLVQSSLFITGMVKSEAWKTVYHTMYFYFSLQPTASALVYQYMYMYNFLSTPNLCVFNSEVSLS